MMLYIHPELDAKLFELWRKSTSSDYVSWLIERLEEGASATKTNIQICDVDAGLSFEEGAGHD